MPLPNDTPQFRSLLFNLDHPIILDEEQFNLYWCLIDNVYSHRKTNIAASGRQTKYYECRLVKSQPSQSKLYLIWQILYLIVCTKQIIFREKIDVPNSEVLKLVPTNIISARPKKSIKKRKISSMHEPGLCQVHIVVIRNEDAGDNSTTYEIKCLHSHITHSHDLETSDRVKVIQFLIIWQTKLKFIQG